jgi:hypothetical protein
MRKFAASIAAVVAVAGAGVMVAPSPAQAYSQWGCVYDGVCFYLTLEDWDAQHPTSRWVDKGYWQNLGSRSYGAFGVINTRNDDTVHLRFTNGFELCIWPNGGTENMQWNYGIVYQLLISDSASC